MSAEAMYPLPPVTHAVFFLSDAGMVAIESLAKG